MSETEGIRKKHRDGLFKRGESWWGDWRDAEGRRHRKKLSPSFDVAKAMLREIKIAITRGEVLGVREENVRFQDFAEKKYWPAVKPTLSPVEQVRAEGILENQLKPTFGGTKLVKLGRESVEGWYTQRLEKVSPATANKELMRLNHLLNKAVSWHYLKANPAKGLKKARPAPGRVRYLSGEEREALLREANPTLRPYILAAMQTGARKGELRGLRWADVDMRARTVTFHHTKNGDSRTIPMNKTLWEALSALPRPLDPEAPVFPSCRPDSITMAFSRLCRRLGIENLRFHDLRHDVASTLTMAGVSQRAIMAVLGHRDPRMSLRYSHLSPGYLRDAMGALDKTPQMGGEEAVSEG